MRKLTLLLLISLLVTGAVGVRLSAQSTEPLPNVMDMSLEDLMKVEVSSVYGASGYKQNVADAPASITIITADEIKRYGYRTLAEILRSVPGFYVTYDRVYDYLGERGFGRPGDYNSRFLLQVDGHRINDNVFDQAYIGTEFPVDVDLIDRIEVIRGPNSSLYVASALLGIINVVTKSVHDAQGLTVAGELASYGTYKSQATYGHHFRNGLEMLLSGSYYNSHGQEALYFPEFNTSATNYGIAHNADYDQYGHFFGELTYGHFRLEGVYSSREKGVPTGAFGIVFNDSANRFIDGRQYLDLKYDRNFGSDGGVTGRVYFDRYPYNDDLRFDLSAVGGPSRAVFEDYGPGQWWGAEGAYSKKLRGNQTLVVGAEFRDNFQQDMVNVLVEPPLSVADVRKSSMVSAVYAQDAIPLHHNVVLDLGLRYDHYSTFGGTVNPRAALIYHPFERTTLKFLYGQSFRAPNAYELYFQSTNPFAQALLPSGNPNLKPETTRTTEMVIEQDIGHQFLVVGSGYYYPIRGLINAATDPLSGAYVYENSQHVNLQGTEVALKRQSRSGLEAGVSLSLQDAQTGNDGPPLTNSPHTLVQANLSVPLFHRKLYASSNVNYVSRRSTLQGNFAPAYAVPNFTLFSNAFKRWEVSVSLYNAFDQRFGDPAGPGNPEDVIIQDGRNIRVRFAYHF